MSSSSENMIKIYPSTNLMTFSSIIAYIHVLCIYNPFSSLIIWLIGNYRQFLSSCSRLFCASHIFEKSIIAPIMAFAIALVIFYILYYFHFIHISFRISFLFFCFLSFISIKSLVYRIVDSIYAECRT